MAAAASKKAFVISLTLATFSVNKQVQERHKYGMSDWSVFESEKRRRTIFNLQRSTAQNHLLLKESSTVSWSVVAGRVFRKDMFRKYQRYSRQFQCTMDCATCEIGKAESMNISLKSSGSIAVWRLAVLKKAKEGCSTTKVAWNKPDACDGLQWFCWGPSWGCLYRQRTLHWMGTCFTERR